MNVFRSIQVQRYSCVISYQTAFHTIMNMISCGYIQFQMSKQEDTRNPFFKILARIRQLINKLQALLDKIENQYQIPLKRLSVQQKALLIAKMKLKIQEKNIDCLKYLDNQQQRIQIKLQHLKIMTQNYQKLENMLENHYNQIDIVRAKLEIFQTQQKFATQFSLITGICKYTQKHIFQRLIFRASRGNSYIIFKQRPIYNPKHHNTCIFLCFNSGRQNSILTGKIKRLCMTNNAQIYNVTNNKQQLHRYLKSLESKIHQIQNLRQLSQKTLYEAINYYVVKQNRPRIIKKLTKLKYLQRISYILCHQPQASAGSNHFLLSFYKPKNEPNPQNIAVIEYPQLQKKTRTVLPLLSCLYESNLLTELFSVPTNKEIIPSAFMLVTIPIFFGMMFSDIGHAILLFVLAYSLGLNTIWYLMAFMSFYFGILFNQFFGMKISLFYKLSGNTLGLDPIWGSALNSLAFQNSLKMKLSMIIGFFHMAFGGILKIVNNYHQKKYKQLIFQTIPKFILMFSTIGYLILLILLKWSINYQKMTSLAPSVINIFLQMYLGPNQKRTISLFNSMETQKSIQFTLKLISAFCLVSIMIGSSIYEKFTKKQKKYSRILQEQDDIEKSIPTQQQSQNRYSQLIKERQQNDSEHFGPLQGFQYLLSLISSITSYLRLFALSLSHQKLSGLLLKYLISGLGDLHPSVSIVRSFSFFIITLSMLSLDIMECLMHVIRLHWVQWMGKFYKGGGIKFHPEIQGEH